MRALACVFLMLPGLSLGGAALAQGPPSCDDPTRTTLAGGPGAGACGDFSGNQAACEAAYHETEPGVAASCFYSDGFCLGCGPPNQTLGLCLNTCVPPPCDNPLRTIHAGGPGTGACTQYNGDLSSCEAAFHITMAGTGASCFYDADFNECLGCGPSNETLGLCLNSCVPSPCDNPLRTIHAGGPSTGACTQYDGDLSSCEAAFHITMAGTGASCFYSDGFCLGCGPSNEGDGVCINMCGPSVCLDATRTIGAGGPNAQACTRYAGDQAACEAAFHITQSGEPASCYYDAEFDDCYGCGPFNELSGFCLNSCGSTPCEDATRTIDTGGPKIGACHAFDGNPTSCAAAYHFTLSGEIASCFYDVAFDECNGCGPTNQGDGICLNQCVASPCGDPTRIIHAGGPHTIACFDYNDDQASCELAFHITDSGPAASCFYDPQFGECFGCGPSNEGAALCTNTCDPNPCGNGLIDAGEACDDGARLNGDGCSSSCQIEPGYVCTGVPSQCSLNRPQSAAQRDCIKELNKRGAQLARAQSKVSARCIKDAAKGKLTGTIEACLTADAKGKVAKAEQKLMSKAQAACTEPPDFGATDPDTMAQAMLEQELALVHASFGSDLDAVILEDATDSAGARCQADTAKRVGQCLDATLKGFNKCKKDGLKAQSITNSSGLEACFGTDPTGKIQKTCETKLAAKLNSKCVSVDPLSTFPACSSIDLSALANCLARSAACHACLALNAADALSADCDALDDGVTNGSCP